MKQSEFEKLSKVEQNFRWDLFLLSDGMYFKPTEREIVDLLRKYVSKYGTNDAEIDYIIGKDDKGNYDYWHYKEPNGSGFSGPNVSEFIKDVLAELKDDINSKPFYL